MHWPTLAEHSFELESAEDRHASVPDTFRIPPLDARANLRRGQAAKLLFLIEGLSDEGQFVQGTERMWVIVSRRVGNVYIGILDNQPAGLTLARNAYLGFGVEIPFRAEHVCDIAQPPEEYVQWQLSQSPERCWPE